MGKGRAALREAGVAARVELRATDFFGVEKGELFRDGDVVVAYLFRDGCAKLAARLAGELRRGVVVCVGFELRGWKCVEARETAGLKVRIYEVDGGG